MTRTPTIWGHRPRSRDFCDHTGMNLWRRTRPGGQGGMTAGHDCQSLMGVQGGWSRRVQSGTRCPVNMTGPASMNGPEHVNDLGPPCLCGWLRWDWDIRREREMLKMSLCSSCISISFWKRCGARAVFTFDGFAAHVHSRSCKSTKLFMPVYTVVNARVHCRSCSCSL
jgi:hypothetical protein